MNTKQIAEEILRQFHAGESRYLPGGLVEFKVDGLTLRCRSDGVFAMSEKYRKGFKASWLTKASTAPPSAARICSMAAFNAFWNDGEQDNAREYLRQFPTDKWPAKALELLG